MVGSIAGVSSMPSSYPNKLHMADQFSKIDELGFLICENAISQGVRH